jgi:GNAT superfamily N-acetyltransferase
LFDSKVVTIIGRLKPFGDNGRYGRGFEVVTIIANDCMMEISGNFHIIAAYMNGELVGFLTMVVSVLPHSGKKFGTMESYFVAQKHRKHGPGLDLLRAAEWLAQACGAIGLLITAPKGGKLARVMPRAKYKHTHEVFFKGFA